MQTTIAYGTVRGDNEQSYFLYNEIIPKAIHRDIDQTRTKERQTVVV
jgi:hypothetical protein